MLQCQWKRFEGCEWGHIPCIVKLKPRFCINKKNQKQFCHWKCLIFQCKYFILMISIFQKRTFSKRDIFKKGHFQKGTFSKRDIFKKGHFQKGTFSKTDILLHSCHLCILFHLFQLFLFLQSV